MKLISGGMIGNSNRIDTNLKGWIQNIPPKEINPIMFLQKKFYSNKNYRTAHWVGYYKLKELDINYFFKIKHMNEKKWNLNRLK